VEALLDLLAERSVDLELDRAALALARIEYPGLDIEPFIAILDSCAVELASRPSDCSGGSEYVEAANQYLFGELGFIGNLQNYYDPRNSCLNEVLIARGHSNCAGSGLPRDRAEAGPAGLRHRAARPFPGAVPRRSFLKHSLTYSTAAGGRVLRACGARDRHRNFPPTRACWHPPASGRS